MVRYGEAPLVSKSFVLGEVPLTLVSPENAGGVNGGVCFTGCVLLDVLRLFLCIISLLSFKHMFESKKVAGP